MYVSLTLPEYQQLAKSSLYLQPTFLLFSQYSLQYMYILSAKETDGEHNFQHIHKTATREVQPSAEIYTSKLLQILQLSYCADHDLYKTLVQQNKLSVRNDEVNSLQTFSD